MVLESGIKTLDNFSREKEEIKKRDNWKLYQVEMNAKDNLSSDPVVNQVIERQIQRSDIGIPKYGCTLADNNLTELEWLVHLQDELLDGANYTQVLINKRKQEKLEFLRKKVEREIAEIIKSILKSKGNYLYRPWSGEIAKNVLDYLIGANII